MSCSIDDKLLEISGKNTSHKNAQQYDKTLFDLQSFLAHEVEKMEPGKVLDVGCAYGTFTAYLADKGWDTYAVDNMPELSSKKWWNKHKITFAQANVETDPIPWDGFDLVLFTEILEHLCYNPVPAIESLFTATKPGGLVVCTSPMKELQGVVHPNEGRYATYGHYRDIPLPINGYTFDDNHHYFFRSSELGQIFHEVGFEVLSVYPIRKGTTHCLVARKP